MRYGKIYIDLSLVLMIGMRLLPGHPYGKRQSTSLNPLRQVLTDRTRVCASSMIRSLYDMSIYEVLLLHLNSGRTRFGLQTSCVQTLMLYGSQSSIL